LAFSAVKILDAAVLGPIALVMAGSASLGGVCVVLEQCVDGLGVR
jgi:hypothetical protein